MRAAVSDTVMSGSFVVAGSGAREAGGFDGGIASMFAAVSGAGVGDLHPDTLRGDAKGFGQLVCAVFASSATAREDGSGLTWRLVSCPAAFLVRSMSS